MVKGSYWGVVFVEAVDISVIIPTRNRAAWLPTCLAHIEQQSFPAGRFEVLVVDDGSTDDTLSVVQRYAQGSPICIRAHHQPHTGLAAARNLGAEKAMGRWLLFLCDDELVSPRLVEQHVTAHQHRALPACVMGTVRRHPQLPRDTFTRQFLDEVTNWENYADAPHFLDWQRSNFSLSRERFQDLGGFSTAQPLYAVNIWELAHRMEQAGLEPIQLADARCYIWQPTTFAAERFRQYHLGFGLFHLQRATRSTLIPERFRLHRTRLQQLVHTLTIPYYVRACNREEEEASMLISGLYKRVLYYDRTVGYQDALADRPPRPPVAEDGKHATLGRGVDF